MKVEPKTVISIVLRVALSLAAAFLGGYLLWRYEYFQSILNIDNFVGAIPIGLIVIFVGGAVALSCMKYDGSRRAAAIILAVFTALSIALFPNALRANWWINFGVTYSEGDNPDITVYEPFTEGNLTARLNEAASLSISEDFPVLDGALALYPVYAAIAQAVYAEEYFQPSSVLFTNTLKAYEGISDGARDVIFVAGANKSQLSYAREAGAELVFTPIGKEAFVFLVGKDNPIDDISYQQIRDIYSGKTAKWGTLGWAEGGDIIAFQRPEGSGSQTGLESVMGDMPIIAPQPLPDKSLVGTNSLLKQVSVRYKGVQPALGYSFRFFAETMYPNPDAKMLSVNGVAPTVENVRNGSYPFVMNFYAVTNGEPQGNVKRLIDWILSPQGQTLIEKCGYVSVN